MTDDVFPAKTLDIDWNHEIREAKRQKAEKDAERELKKSQEGTWQLRTHDPVFGPDVEHWHCDVPVYRDIHMDMCIYEEKWKIDIFLNLGFGGTSGQVARGDVCGSIEETKMMLKVMSASYMSEAWADRQWANW